MQQPNTHASDKLATTGNIWTIQMHNGNICLQAEYSSLSSPSGCKNSKAWSSMHFAAMARHTECASLQQWNKNRHNVHRRTIEIFQKQPVTISDGTQQ